MSFMVIFKKELKDSLSRGVLISLVIGLLAVMIISAVIQMINPSSSSDDKVNIGILNLDKQDISWDAKNILECNANIIYPVLEDYTIVNNSTDIVEITHNETLEEAIEDTRIRGGKALIVIEKGFSESIRNNISGKISIYWIIESYGTKDTFSTTTDIEALIETLISNLTALMIEENSLNSSIIMNPISTNENTVIKGKEYKDTTLNQATGIISLVVMSIPIMIIYMVMFLGANIITAFIKERSWDTLETLLSFPIKRRNLIIAKILATILSLMFIMTIISIGIVSILSAILGVASESSEEPVVTLSKIDLLLIGITTIVSVICAMSFYAFSGMYASSNSKAGWLSLPTILLFTIPLGVLIIFDYSTMSMFWKIFLGYLPGSQPSIAINGIVNKNYPLTILSISYMTFISITMSYLAVKLFRSDRMVE